MEVILQSIKKFRVLWIFAIGFAVLAFVANYTRTSREDIVYHEALDLVVATVEEQEITLRDFAVYVAHQEATVQEQAKIYDPEDTHKYWNVHTDGTYISHAARNQAMAMAIHDELFYQLSQEFSVSFTEDEMQTLQNDVDDFWYDLTDDGKEQMLGITKEDVYNSMYKIACAQKGQLICAGIDGVAYEDYDFNQEEYLDFLADYKYEVKERVLYRIDFGDVTLEHE